ncbi:hypothetical protein DFH06DRAFT_937488, partial [Mycena polygramma]
HNMTRGITGLGEGNGPFISIHDGFDGTASWAVFLPGSDRIILDTRQYSLNIPSLPNAPLCVPLLPLTSPFLFWDGKFPFWTPRLTFLFLDSSRMAFGVTVAGEFSNGYEDCGLFLTGV